jgi:DNA-binding transcriptional LysR family regulator
MPACLQAFGKKFPDVEVTLVEIDLNAQVAAVAAGAIEIGFTLRKEPAALKGLQHTVVVREPLTVLLSADHPFGKLRRVPIAELAGQRLLAVGGQKISSHSDLIKSVLTMCGVAAGAPRTVNGYEAFLAMVASGQGISLLPRMPSHGAVAGLTTRPLKEAHPALVLEARAVWRDARAAPIVNNFVEIMRAKRPRASRPGAESRSA